MYHHQVSNWALLSRSIPRIWFLRVRVTMEFFSCLSKGHYGVFFLFFERKEKLVKLL